MCGLIGLVARFDPDAQVSLAPLARAEAALGSWAPEGADAAATLLALADGLAPLSRELIGWPGYSLLRAEPAARDRVAAVAAALRRAAARVDERLAAPSGVASAAEGEALAVAAIAARDVAWRIAEDALPNVEAVRALAPAGDPGDEGAPLKAWFELWRINLVLNQLGRLEVRGRDSGGLATLVRLPGAAADELAAELRAGGLDAELTRRLGIDCLRDGAVLRCRRSAAPAADPSVAPEGVGGGGAGEVVLAFAHKVAREVGELGANVRELREKVRADALYRRALAHPAAEVQVLAHTRWASNGIINEPNCHPVANELAADRGGADLDRIVLAVLNGDVDNYPTLADGWAIPSACTTDAKIIPLEVARRLDEAASALDLGEAFRSAAATFLGSTAIAALGSDDPGRVFLATRGSGQAIYVGVIDGGGYLFASELYGVVELASRYYKLDGEAGEVVCLGPGEGVSGLAAARYDGAPLPLDASLLRPVPIATRDIDRAEHAHFFIKEISEGPRSVERTLRGKFVLDADGRGARFLFGDEVIPPAIRAALSAPAQGGDAAGAGAGTRRIRRVFVIGQGTAAVAGQAVAELMGQLLRPVGIEVRGLPATELSGYFLDLVGPDTLVVAVSQSGTTTDTNCTVDLARERGAFVIAIVNRRGSDLADKAHGVLYTSDGRDVEMSVASTKAFYCQVVAGYLLALQAASLAGAITPEELAVRLLRLEDLPRCLRAVLEESRERIRQAALLALRRSHWTVVGSGPLLPAAREIRIKLSELCYKSVSVDTIEDKKHIDLSSEPMVLVCAAGLNGAAAADAVKEVAIFRAHAAIPIVICDRGETRFAEYAAATIEVPASSTEVALLLNAIAGHLFSYEVARAIDACSAPLRRARDITEAALDSLRHASEEPSPEEVSGTLNRLHTALLPLAREVDAAVAQGGWNAAMAPDCAHRLVGRLTGVLLLGAAMRGAGAAAAQGAALAWPGPAAAGAPPAPRALLELLLAELAQGVDALRRPIDAIKHQAKTVTVGISREAAARPPAGVLVRALEGCGVAAEGLADQDAAALASLEPAIAAAPGAVRYRLEALSPLGAPTDASRVQAIAKSGLAAQLLSRADAGASLEGTKRMIVHSPRVWVGYGQRDGRALVLCPVYEGGLVAGLGLVHVAFRADLDTRGRARALKAVGRYEDLRCAVTELDLPWSDDLLHAAPLEELLTCSAERLAEMILLERGGASGEETILSGGGRARDGGPA